MTAITTIPDAIATLLVTAPTEQMTRKQFNGYLYDLFECTTTNNVDADELYDTASVYVEVFSSTPAGRIVAVHHGDALERVSIYREAA